MNNDNLQTIWRKMHIQDKNYSESDIKKIIIMQHSEVISTTLSDQKKKICIYSSVFTVYLGLMIYAFIYLNLNLSIEAIMPLSIAGIFLFFKSSSEINRYRIMDSIPKDISIKESILIFQKKLKNIKKQDFIFNLAFYYSLAILLITTTNDIRNLMNGKDTMLLTYLLILILLLVPWVIRYIHSQRYKKLYLSLKSSIKLLEGDI